MDAVATDGKYAVAVVTASWRRATDVARLSIRQPLARGGGVIASSPGAVVGLGPTSGIRGEAAWSRPRRYLGKLRVFERKVAELRAGFAATRHHEAGASEQARAHLLPVVRLARVRHSSLRTQRARAGAATRAGSAADFRFEWRRSRRRRRRRVCRGFAFRRSPGLALRS